MLLHPARPWLLRPIDDQPPGPGPADGHWPSVGVVIPARNEAESIAGTLAALHDQDYPGHMRIVVVDERSSDGTADAARRAAADPGARHLTVGARHLTVVVPGAALPEEWVGKVWGMEQGLRVLEDGGDPPEWVLFTDADIHHAPDSLRALMASAMDGCVGLESRMARLRCSSRAEKLLIPPFVLFFFLLYPPLWANRPGSRIASAAGGCNLVRRDALRAAGGLRAIRGALIDDLAMARLIKFRARMPTRLALAAGRVASTRPYDDLASIWTMVRRSAFTQLRRSWPLLAGVLLVLLLMFAGPLVAVVAGAVGLAAGAGTGAAWTLGVGLAAWLAMAVASGPASRQFGLGWPWRFALPLSGLLYGAMTLDSALRGPRGGGWR